MNINSQHIKKWLEFRWVCAKQMARQQPEWKEIHCKDMAICWKAFVHFCTEDLKENHGDFKNYLELRDAIGSPRTEKHDEAIVRAKMISSMVENDLSSIIMSAVGQESAKIGEIVEYVMKKVPSVNESQARAMVERFVDRGKLRLNLDMRLESSTVNG